MLRLRSSSGPPQVCKFYHEVGGGMSLVATCRKAVFKRGEAVCLGAPSSWV
jgi:hypothetical protein